MTLKGWSWNFDESGPMDEEDYRDAMYAAQYKGTPKMIRLPGDDTPDVQSAGSPYWETQPGQYSSEYFTDFRDPEGWYKAHVKRDGCVEFTRFFNVPAALDDFAPDTYDHIHICDLDDFIERLQALRAAAIEHYGDAWPF